jgi:hypothetical protein
MTDLVCILNTSDQYFFEICRSILINNDIEFKEKNTVDSMYQNFGSSSLFVIPSAAELAKQLIEPKHE